MAENWLQELKVGDEVGVASTMRIKIVRVERVTPKRIYVDRETFDRETGRGLACYLFLKQATPELRDSMLRYALIAKIEGTAALRNASEDKLNRIIAILEEKNEKELP
jgi:hypothetical protein